MDDFSLSQSLNASPLDVRAAPSIAAGSGIADAQGFVDLWQKLWAGKGTLIAIMAGCLCIAFLVGALQTPLYRAQSSFEVQDLNDKFMDLKAVDPTDTSTYGPESYIQTEIRIAKSRSLIERTLTKLPPSERTRLVEAPRLWWSRYTHEQFLEKISDRLEARPSRQARIIDISFLSPDATASADFVNTLTQELSDYNLERRWKTSQRTREWLERQMSDFRKRLEASETQLQVYARTSNLIFTSDKSDVSESKLLQLQEELSKAQADRMTKEANYRRISQADADSLPEVVSDATLRELRLRLADLHRQLAEFEAIYTPHHQAVIKLKAQVTAVQAMFDRRRTSIVEQIKNEYESALGRERLLQSTYAQQTKVVTRQAEKSVHYNVLKREVETNRALYESIMTRMQEAGVASAMKANNLLVIDPAYPEKKPSYPNYGMNGLMGALIGCMLGTSYILFKGHVTRTFLEPGVTSTYLGLRELGVIPSDRYLRQLSLFSPGFDGGTGLHLTFDKGPQSAESYRSLRSSILHQMEQRQGPRRLVVTSAAAREGKSTVISNLGAAVASANHRVLLIDGDLRRSKLHEIFDKRNDRGLVDVLSHELPVPSTELSDFILETRVPGLFLLPAGRSGVNGPELLSSGGVPELIREISKDFDLVLIDSPPLLPFSDARSLARAADAVILVVRAGATDRRSALRAKDTLVQDGISIAGTILTDWNAADTTMKYYKAYQETA